MKSKSYRVPTNFKIPKDYRGRFVFVGGNIRMTIEARPPSTMKLTVTQIGPEIVEDRSPGLDWIHEATEMIRVESGYYDA